MRTRVEPSARRALYSIALARTTAPRACISCGGAQSLRPEHPEHQLACLYNQLSFIALSPMRRWSKNCFGEHP
jgi:hypothetical protein